MRTQAEAMTTLSPTGLEACLARLGLDVPIPTFEGADVLNKPMDIARSYLADILRKLTGCSTAAAPGAIVWSHNIDNGDLVVILPKLTTHDTKPQELGFKIMEQV